MSKLSNIFKTKPEKESVELVNYIKNFANRSRKNRAYKRQFWNVAAKLEAFQSERNLCIFTGNFPVQVVEDIFYYFSEKCNYRSETIRSYITKIKTVMLAASREGYLVDFSINEFRLKKEESTAVYLTSAEIERINSLSIKPDNSAIRDRFLIGCCTGLRFSDYSKLTISSISNGSISVRTQKTGARVIIPVHWIVEDVLKRNNGIFPPLLTSQQNFNKRIKLICRKAKITEAVTVEIKRGNKIEKHKKKKYELIGSHTARRSFATNMYLLGVQTAKIMLFTGHTTEESFFRYIRIGKAENAKELADHPFFKKIT